MDENSLYQQQKQRKPAIEELIDLHLTGEKRQRALDFTVFLRENKLSPQWGSTNTYNISYKSRRVCVLKIFPDDFELRLSTQYNEEFNRCFVNEAEDVKDFLVLNVVSCFGCGTCKPGVKMNIFGKRFDCACLNPVIRFCNPNDKSITLAEKLVLLRKEAISQDKAPPTTYISIKKR